MKKEWSKKWRSSKQPRKQRKYSFNAAHHTRQALMGCPLSKELKKKHSTRSATLRSGDKVKVTRGKFRGQSGSVDRVDHSNATAYITGIEIIKGEGSKVIPPIKASNLVITELNLNDKRRFKRSKEGKKETEKQPEEGTKNKTR